MEVGYFQSSAVTQDILAQGLLASQESRKTIKLHHATNLTGEIYWGRSTEWWLLMNRKRGNRGLHRGNDVMGFSECVH